MNESLITAVKEQIGQDDDADYDPLSDVANNGIDGGFPGFTYYSDTCSFFEDNKSDILDLVKGMAEDFDQDPIGFVAAFNCLTDDRETREEIGRCIYGTPNDSDYIVPNALAWFAAEEVARLTE